MGGMANQITSLTIVYSTVDSGASQIKHQSSVSLAFIHGIHRWQGTNNAENVSIWWRHHDINFTGDAESTYMGVYRKNERAPPDNHHTNIIIMTRDEGHGVSHHRHLDYFSQSPVQANSKETSITVSLWDGNPRLDSPHKIWKIFYVIHVVTIFDRTCILIWYQNGRRCLYGLSNTPNTLIMMYIDINYWNAAKVWACQK